MANQNTKQTTAPALRPYQLTGVEQLLRLTSTRGAAILADDPGLGKTAVTAEYINRTRPENILIVCPASLRLNWRKELDRWLTWKPFDVQIISYEAAAAGKAEVSTLFPRFDLAVFDEAHYLKNPAAKRTKACLAIPAATRIFLTGTPVVNRPMDLFPILQSCGMKLTKNDFGKRYCAGRLVCIRWKPRKKYAWDFSGASHADELSAALRKSVMVRRTKAEVLTELPAKIRQVIEIDAPHGESKKLRDAVTGMFDGLAKADANLGTLKQIAFQELSAARLENARHKLPYVVEFAKNLLEEEEKLVVFAYHREVIDTLIELLDGIPAVKLYGGMTDKQKDAAVEAFQTGPARVFAGQITAAGTGLTLTASSTVLFAELDWVPGNVTQAEDRCHRLGQRETVRVIHLVLKDSIDGRMVRSLVEKQNVIERVVK